VKLKKSSALVALALMSTLAAGCSASSTGGGSPSADSSLSPAAAAGLEEAKAQVKQFATEPTEIGPTEPLEENPPKGKTFVWMECELPQCGMLSDGFRAATAALGWNYEAITYQVADPSSLVAGLKQALKLNPAGVSVGALPQEVWQSVVPDYAAANVPIIPVGIGKATLDETVIGNVLTWDDFAKFGAVNANWFIADSNGAGHALIVNVPAYGILQAFTEGATAEIEKNCPGCAAEELELSLNQVGANQVNSAIVSALQKDPSIKYVIVSNAPFATGLSSSLAAAGISDIRILGNAPSVADQQALLDGEAHAFTGENYSYESWNAVDILLRHQQGLSIPVDGGGAPVWLLTKENMGTPADQTSAPVGYEEQFKKLWFAGS